MLYNLQNFALYHRVPCSLSRVLALYLYWVQVDIVYRNPTIPLSSLAHHPPPAPTTMSKSNSGRPSMSPKTHKLKSTFGKRYRTYYSGPSLVVPDDYISHPPICSANALCVQRASDIYTNILL
ncbi:uncharacterized protein EI97DRAFT_472545 [Westerdykella ornata]|uniref:Uncharacterized protein n=1 Tax=Westerdykella ornata TaxID=318751 RepID=A0A6A6JXU5_WESOR|nr:uncharacterized protein EI97DRAFT_472545 [Westerdykella ornata]KAF2281227.1 hypothetical protein EI97DRAFT_472545 [Westerdykella ornata]